MHENYRKTDSEELHYFVTRLLPCVNTKYTSYNKKCRDKRVSEVFTPNDEAFALALLMNELESYNFIIAKREKAITSNTMKKKTFHKQCKWEQGRLEPSWTRDI